MPKKRGEPGDAASSFFDESPAPAPTEEPQKSDEKPAARLSIPITESGDIDTPRMKKSTREKLQRALQPTEAKVPAEKPKYPREFVPPMYDTLCLAIRNVGGIFFKWPKDFQALIAFNEEEKKNLTEPTALMIDKYAPDFMAKYAVEINFLNAITASGASMVQRAVTQWIQSHPQPAPVIVPGATDSPTSPAAEPEPGFKPIGAAA